MLKDLEAILFDLDGTMWNSEEEVCNTWNQVVAKHPECRKGPITLEELKGCFGLPMTKIAEKLFSEVSSKEQQIIMDECCELENSYLNEHGAKLYPKLEETLMELKKKYKLFVVSNCQQGYIESFMDICQMETGFLQYTMELLENEYADELKILKIDLPKVDKIPYVRFDEAKKLVSEKYGKSIKNPFDLEPEEEELIGKYFREKDWKTYTIEVHALKSAARQIGALKLSELAEALEHAGKEGNLEFIYKHTEELLESYYSQKDIFSVFFPEDSKPENRKEISSELLKELLHGLKEALDCLDLNEMDSIMEQMTGYAYLEKQEELYSGLKAAIEEFDMETGGDIITKWLEVFE